jgi:putative hydrolase of the HAD superfamily
MTRAVFFDVDGVLVHGYHARPELTRRWNEHLLADLGVDPDRFNDEFIFDIFIKKVVVGEMAIIDALERRLPGLGYKGSPMVFLHYWLSHDSTLNTDLVEVVRKLKVRGDLKLYIATNQDHSRAQWLWQTMRLGELFEDIFYSARIGVRKPEQGFFDFIEHRIGPQDEPPLFFDDTPKVIDGARRHGWEAVQFETVDDCTSHPWIAARL